MEGKLNVGADGVEATVVLVVGHTGEEQANAFL